MDETPPKSFRRRLDPRIAAAAILLTSAPAWAYQWQSARLVAMQGSARAAGVGADGLFSNPAGISFPGAYILDAGYADDFREGDRRAHLSITDSSTNRRVAGAVAFTYGRARPAQDPDPSLLLEGYRVDAALSVRASERFALGAAVRGFDYNILENGRLRPDQSNGDLAEVTMDVGFQWQLADPLRLGVVAQNLTNTRRAEVPLTLGGGLALTVDALILESDLFWESFTDVNQVDQDSWNVTFGGSYTIQKIVPVRVGVVYDFLQEEVGVSGGVGILIERLNIEAAYSQRVTNANDYRGDDERLFVVSVGLQLF